MGFGIGLFLIAWILVGGYFVVTMTVHWNLKPDEAAPGLLASVAFTALITFTLLGLIK